VLDRFIQQAVMQVLQRRWDRTFSQHSYGFRPGVGTGLKRSHFHRFEGKHWVPVFEVRRHECVGSMKKEPAVLQSQV